jgi:mannose/cellobiose epimerase-like protein (N-acyl-D-glucosamine 2-epimerase family)
MSPHTPALPDFRTRAAILAHARSILDFYDPRAVDPSGGFFHFLKDDGTVYDRHTRHLVSSTRYVFLWSMAARHLPGHPAYLAHARRALAFLRDVHRQPHSGGYAWTLDWRDGRARVTDATHHAYGLSFVMLAYAHALMAGMEEARTWLDETFDLMQHRFWQPEFGLYADEASEDWVVKPYRGQNANMHAVEACLAAYEATADARYLERAATVAESLVQRQAQLSKGLIWEHYREDWSIDWDYNRGDMSNIFRPWGYQPGHFTEWARLLLKLEQELTTPTPRAPWRERTALAERSWDWLLPRACELFDTALRHGWDEVHQGIVYGFGPDFTVCDARKYHWVQCETLATAAVLARRTGQAVYWGWYDRLWDYCWRHWVDHRHGAWFRILEPNNVKTTDEKSPAGKVDYHTTGACWAILPALQG